MTVYGNGGFIRLQGLIGDDEIESRKTGCYACQSCQCNVDNSCQKCQSCQSCNIGC
jgi:hypothetical protein